MPTPLQRDHWPRPIRQRAQSLYNRTDPPMPAAQIAKELEADPQFVGQPTPSERTIHGWVRRGVLERADEHRPWQWSDGTPEDARLVLETLRGHADRHGDRYAYLVSRAEGEAIARLRRVVPDAPAHWVIPLAYRAAAGDESGTVDTIVRLQPWRDDQVLEQMAKDDELPEDVAEVAEVAAFMRWIGEEER